MQKIPAYVINLARREDRLAHISAHLKMRGVAFTRVDAVDYQSLDKAIIGRILQSNAASHYMGIREWCCLFSHMKALRSFLESPHKAGLFLEDDIYLSADIAQLLADDNWLQKDVNLVKLDRWAEIYSKNKDFLFSVPFGKLPVNRSLRKIGSTYLGGGAYIFSREGARRALTFSEKAELPIDRILFDIDRSALTRVLRPSIIIPCMAGHPDISDSDISVNKPPRKKTKFLRIYDFIMRLLFRVRRYSYRQFLVFFMNMRYISPVFQEDMDVPEKPDEKEKH